MAIPNPRVEIKLAFYGWQYRHYFKIVECIGKNIRVKCMLCPEDKCLSTSVLSNSNLKKHLSKVHKLKLKPKLKGRNTKKGVENASAARSEPEKLSPGGPCFDIMNGSQSSSINVPCLPVTKTEPESLSSGETDVGDSDLNLTESKRTCLRGISSSRASFVARAPEAEDLRTIYCSYLKKEIENRDQQMAYRALKMRKLEKEMLLLDKQLM